MAVFDSVRAPQKLKLKLRRRLHNNVCRSLSFEDDSISDMSHSPNNASLTPERMTVSYSVRAPQKLKLKLRRRLHNNVYRSLSFEDDSISDGTPASLTISEMPSTSEESALLGIFPIDNMDDIELNLQVPSTSRLFNVENTCAETHIRTDRGAILVAIQGDRVKPAILTYHDLGLNYASFQAFFKFVDMRALLEDFCVYHVNAPGQEEGAPCLLEDFVYPTMDELAYQINYVLDRFSIKSFIGMGVGAGANILARYALAHPQKVDALTLINCTPNKPGWIEWGYQKLNSHFLRHTGMTDSVCAYLMWHHFGRQCEERIPDLSLMYRNYFTRNVNATNLSMFIESYLARTDLGISREGETIKVPVLNITGALSPHVEDTVSLNSRLSPSNSTWLKISDCAMVLEEQPGKIAEAFRLFLQGEGYAVLSLQKVSTLVRLASQMSITA